MPYQLHCCPLTALDATELDTTELDTTELDTTELDTTELLTLLTGADETGEELGVDDVAPPQILPVIVGRSALPPRLSI